jgi:hypothetical protein
MATARMLNKNISVSEKVADLKDDSARLLYTWLIPHTDDLGLIVASSRTIRATVVPMLDSTVETVGIQLESMCEVGLLKRITYKTKDYFYVIGSDKYQTLKKDRQPNTVLEFDMGEDRLENWKNLQQLVANLVSGFQTVPVGTEMDPEVKGSEEKLREEKRRERKGSVKGNNIAVADTPADLLTGYEKAKQMRERLGK